MKTVAEWRENKRNQEDYSRKALATREVVEEFMAMVDMSEQEVGDLGEIERLNPELDKTLLERIFEEYELCYRRRD